MASSRQVFRQLRTIASRAAAATSLRAAPRTLSTGNRLLVAGGLLGASVVSAQVSFASEPVVDFDKVRAAIEAIIEDEDHDDGNLGPIFIRLSWHASGTYSCAGGTGGSSTGASMRFEPESAWGANAGLDLARGRLEVVKQQFPGLSYADLWTLAGVVAVESMGGPAIAWQSGRSDCTPETCPMLPDGLLPDASQGRDHLRDIFYRMGMNDQEIVALSGAHTFGRCHTTSSGFTGPWTNAPTTFSNLYFKELTQNTWTWKDWAGPAQLEDPTGELMMLPTDIALLFDKSFRSHVDRYAADEDVFANDFASAFSKLLAFGLSPSKPWYQFW